MNHDAPEETEDPGTSEGAEPPEGGADPRDVRITELEERLRDTEARLRAVSKAFADQRNEMAAFRQRTEALDKIKVERKEFEVVQTFFEPVENLHRSIEAGVGDPEAFLAGLRMIEQQFMDALHRLGLAEVPGVGAPFDPNVHEALGVVAVGDPEQDQKVVAVHERGWTVRGKVLEAAKVVVGRHEAGGNPTEA